MDLFGQQIENISRRLFLKNAAFGLGGAALACLLKRDAFGSTTELDVTSGIHHHPPRAKRVIYIHLVGAPSHLDLFDYKP